MNSINLLLITGCLIVLIFDSLSSIASRRFNFNYGKVAPLSLIIYVAIGFFGAKKSDQTGTIIVAGAVGFFDATIGWKVSMLLKANTGDIDNNPSVFKWITTAIILTALAAICGLLGTELVKWMG